MARLKVKINNSDRFLVLFYLGIVNYHVYTTYVLREIVSNKGLKGAFKLSLVRITLYFCDSLIVYTFSLLKPPVLLRRIKPVKLDVEITFIENASIIRDVHFI